MEISWWTPILDARQLFYKQAMKEMKNQQETNSERNERSQLSLGWFCHNGLSHVSMRLVLEDECRDSCSRHILARLKPFQSKVLSVLSVNICKITDSVSNRIRPNWFLQNQTQGCKLGLERCHTYTKTKTQVIWMVTLTWHASKHKVHKLLRIKTASHINKSIGKYKKANDFLFCFCIMFFKDIYIVLTRMPGQNYHRRFGSLLCLCDSP